MKKKDYSRPSCTTVIFQSKALLASSSPNVPIGGGQTEEAGSRQTDIGKVDVWESDE